ncbi:MAG: TorF family putative porin [Ghiorsea sp.]
MTIKLKSYAMALMLGTGLMGVNANAHASDLEIGADMGVFSQYVWRGQAQGNGESSVQGDFAASFTENLSANVWFATLGSGDATEFDYTIDYSGEAGDFGYSLGVIAYRFHNNDAANAEEVYLGVSYGVASATYYYDSDSKNAWVDLGAGTEVSGFALDATASYSLPDVGTSEFVNLALGISKDVEVGDTVISPSFAYHSHMGALDAVATPDMVVFGFNVAY